MSTTSIHSTWSDRRLRMIADLGGGITLWTISIYSHTPPSYDYQRTGTAIAVFSGENLEDAITGEGDTIYNEIYRFASSSARRLKRGRTNVRQ